MEKQKLKLNYRESNFELLRILCMIMLVAFHGIAHGGAAYMEMCGNKIISLLLVPGGKICFNAFIAISTYFLVDSTFKAERALKIWLEVLFYSVLLFFVSIKFGTPMELRSLISVFFPISGNSHGFAASYIAFYLITPFLCRIGKTVNKGQLRVLVCLLFYYQVVSQILGDIFKYTQPISSELLLFVFWYFLQLYLKRYPLNIQNNPIVMGLIAFGCWLIVFGVVYVFFGVGYNGEVGTLLWNFINDESSVVNIIAGGALFYLFKNIRMPYSKTINRLATCTFGVLLIHDHNFFRYPLWMQIVKVPENYYRSDFVFWIASYTICIFGICCLIDFARQICIERPIFHLNSLKKWADQWNNKLCVEEGKKGNAV